MQHDKYRGSTFSFSTAGRGVRGPEINVTPLIDVPLTLIFRFHGRRLTMDREGEESRES